MDFITIYLIFQLPELEIENEKLKNDLKQLREALSEDAGDNGHFKEMIGEQKILILSVYQVMC